VAGCGLRLSLCMCVCVCVCVCVSCFFRSKHDHSDPMMEVKKNAHTTLGIPKVIHAFTRSFMRARMFNRLQS
jgi:hypothetical protein